MNEKWIQKFPESQNISEKPLIERWRKYHSGTICKGVSNPQTSNAFTGCDKEEIPKCVPRRYRQRIRMKLKKSFMKMKGKNGILLFVFNLKGLLEEWKWR